MANPDLSGCMLGDFQLIKPIGKGGHSTVYLCVQVSLKRNAVVKVAHSRQPDEETRQRFRQEARLAARLLCPYAAQIYAFGITPAPDDKGWILWIAMELVQGITVSDWLKQYGPMPPETLVPLFERITEVLSEAHQLGIVHRDLKPSNIMVIVRRGRMEPKLLDFGIAKMLRDIAAQSGDAPGPDDVVTARIRVKPVPVEHPPSAPSEVPWMRNGYQGITVPGLPLGTLEYMAPEQWYEAETVDRTADTYSLGILLFEVLTGRQPFYGRSSDEYYRLHRYRDVPLLHWQFGPKVDQVIQRACSKSPRDRYGDVLEMASDLRAALQVVKREHLSATAEQWVDMGQPRGMLWGPEVLKRVTVPPEGFSKPECSFITRSQRHTQRKRWLWRSAIALLAVGAFVIAAMKIRLAHEQARMAQERARAAERLTDAAERLTEAVAAESELEQGRAALRYGEPEALFHLVKAYQHDHSPSTAFMVARAFQPRLAEQARFPSSFGRIWSVAYSPNGRQIIVTDDRGAQVWDAQTHQLLFALPHGTEVYHAVYSTDGVRLVTVAQDAVRIWDASSGGLVQLLTKKHNDHEPSDYYIAAISFDGRLVAAVNAAGSVTQVWDAITGVALAKLRNDGAEFPGLAFSSDGHWLATTGGNDVRVFDTQTWRVALTIHGPRIHRIAFDPTAARLVTGAATGDVSIWAIPSGTRIQHLRDGGDPVDAVALSSDGQLVAVGSGDGTEQVWHAGSGALQCQINLRHGKIYAVEFDRSSRFVLAASGDGAVVVADVALGMPVTVLEGQQHAVRVAHFDPSSRHVVGASRDGTARVWDATPPYHRWSSPPMSDDCGLGTSPEPDGRYVAVGCGDRATRIWDTSHDQLLAELPSVSHVDGEFTSAFPAVSSAGDRAAIARGNTVEVYELPGRRLLRTIEHTAAVNAVAFGRTRNDIASGAVDGTLLITRDDGVRLALPSSPGGIDSVALLPDGRLSASDTQRRLRIFDANGAVLAELAIPARVMSLRVDGARLVTVPIAPPIGNAAPPLLIDLEHYRIIAQLDSHVGRVFSARWVAEHQILTAGGDGTARLWDGSTGRLRQIYQGGSRFLADATLTSDGLVIAGGADGLLRFWDQASGRLLWALPTHKSPIIGVHVEGSDIVTREFTGELSRWTLPTLEQAIGACGDQEGCAIVRP